MASFKKNEEGVSAVIGVILMVAITVILAAVIAAFVFQLGGNINTSKVVSLNIERVNSSCIYVKNMGGTDAGSLISLGTPAANAVNVSINGVEVADASTTGFVNNQVGSMAYYYGVGLNSQYTVVGNFNDGSQQVLLSGTI